MGSPKRVRHGGDGTAEALRARLTDGLDQVKGCALTLMQALIASPCEIEVGDDNDGNDHIWLLHGGKRECTDFLCQDDRRDDDGSWPLAQAVFGEDDPEELRATSDEFHALALLWQRCGGIRQALVPGTPQQVGGVIEQQRAQRATTGR